MDIAMCICAAAAALLLMLEAALMIGARNRKTALPAFVAVVPVIPDDERLHERLSTVSDMRAVGRLCGGKIILLDLSAGPEQLQICRVYCETEPDAEIVHYNDLGAYLESWCRCRK